jgi:AraC family transcriptional regulator
MKSSVVVQPTLRVASVRHIGPYQEIGKAFGQLGAAAQGADLLGPSVEMIGIYHDDPETTPASQLRADAGIVVEDVASIPPTLTETSLAGGRYLHTRHLGPYDGLPAAWAYLREAAMGEHGVTRGDGPAYELYPNNPGNAAASDLITDIYIPIR